MVTFSVEKPSKKSNQPLCAVMQMKQLLKLLSHAAFSVRAWFATNYTP